MTTTDLSASLIAHFSHVPTGDQRTAIHHLSSLLLSQKEHPVYILKGFAGTGKTSLLSAVVACLSQQRSKFVLLAPTGRAAKVLSKYAGISAHTIHRFIYHLTRNAEGYHRITLANNILKNTVFIVDEASMIGDNLQNEDQAFSSRNLLDDLVQYVFSQAGNKIIMVGDVAQLPPVGLSLSPALDLQNMRNAYPITAYSFEMKEVMRQALDSGILQTATLLRQKISSKDQLLPLFQKAAFKNDIQVVDNGYELEELLQSAFLGSEADEGVVICRSNKRANLFNNQIRTGILGRENRIEGGDRLMIVKNNYYWLDKKSNTGFLANGDLIQLLRIRKTEEIYGFQFADAEIRLTDYPEEKEIEVKLLLNTLDTETAGLSVQDHQRLFTAIEADYAHIPNKRDRMAELQKNPYYNALHIKFAYAFTCHKAQGGQWPNVFIDQGYLTDDMINTEYLRWLYTALSRATRKVYLVHFREELFE